LNGLVTADPPAGLQMVTEGGAAAGAHTALVEDVATVVLTEL